MQRRIFPVVMTASPEGIDTFDADRIGTLVDRIIAARQGRPDGPAAPLI